MTALITSDRDDPPLLSGHLRLFMEEGLWRRDGGELGDDRV